MQRLAGLGGCFTRKVDFVMKDCFPLVSIGMPVWNSQETLLPAINSLLAQTYPYWELLVIDDGSSDGTLLAAQQASDPRITVHSDCLHRGIPFRRNQAIGMSQGEYFAYLDSDDVAYPDRLECQVNYLERNPQVDLVGASMLIFGQSGKLLGKRVVPETHSAICSRPYTGFPMAQPTFMGRIEWFRRHGYRNEMKRAEDQDLLLRSYRTSKFANMPKILVGYREEHINLRKTLLNRRYLAQALFVEFKRQDRLGLAMRAVAEQVLKGMVDGLAVASGLNYQVLRHRVQPTTPDEEQTWEQTWQRVNQSVDNHAA